MQKCWCIKAGFYGICSRLEGTNEDKPTEEELEEIFHLLENIKSPQDSSSAQTLTPIQPADRSVTLSGLHISSPLLFLLPNIPMTTKPHMNILRPAHGLDYCTAVLGLV